jgi:3-hydroxyisobutyrate dehydrogenase
MNKQFGGSRAATPAEDANDADVVFTCGGADDDLRSVTVGADGAFSSLSAGAILIDHTNAGRWKASISP